MLPLKDLKVVDFGQGIAGPYASMLLGDFGANVIKVEPLRGDWSRSLGVAINQTTSPAYISVNYNKRSIAIDIKQKKGLEVVKSIVKDADIIVQSFRPNIMKRYGLDYQSLSDKNMKLIYCSVSGFGEDGPWANLPAGDSTMQAWAGLMSIVGSEDQEPTRVGNVVADMMAGMNVFQGAILSLLRRSKTGKGGEVKTSLLDTLIAFQSPVFTEYLFSRKLPKRTGNNHPLVSPSGLFFTKDKPIVFTVLEHQWATFCNNFELTHLIDDSRFDTNDKRIKNRLELMSLIIPKFSQLSASAVLDKLRSADVPCAPVNNYDDIALDPQVIHNSLFRMLDHPIFGRVPHIKNPVRIDSIDSPMRHAPLLGEHTEAILYDNGLSQNEIHKLRQKKIIS